MLGFLAIDLAFLRAVDAAEEDTFRMVAVQHFEGVAVEDGNDGAGEVGGNDRAHEWPEEKERGNKKATH